jgi:excisionase family DNA binding protein
VTYVFIQETNLGRPRSNFNPDTSQVVGTKDAAAVLGVSVSTIQKMVSAGRLPAWTTSGGHRRIRVDDLRRAADQMRIPGDLVTPVAAQAAAARPAGPLEILVVEDNALAAKALTRVLEQYGDRVQVRVTSDAAEALLQLGESTPGLLITDLVMKPFDGFHLLRVLAGSERLARVPVMVVTGLNDKDIAASGSLPPGVPVFHKPLHPERLLGFVDAVLTLRH